MYGIISKLSGNRGSYMFCIKCGSQIPEEAKFCPKCGQAVQEREKTK